jgi:hypothetical protein
MFSKKTKQHKTKTIAEDNLIDAGKNADSVDLLQN